DVGLERRRRELELGLDEQLPHDAREHDRRRARRAPIVEHLEPRLGERIGEDVGQERLGRLGAEDARRVHVVAVLLHAAADLRATGPGTRMERPSPRRDEAATFFASGWRTLTSPNAQPATTRAASAAIGPRLMAAL